MGTTPDQLRQEIEQTRANLTYDADRLAEKVRPGAVVQRRTAAVQGRLSSLKDRVMGRSPYGGGSGSGFGSTMGGAASGMSGAASNVGSSVSGAASNVGSTVSDAASSAAETVQRMPGQVTRQAEGNPLAAGLIAFGAGMLLSSLMPTSRVEQQAAMGLKDRAEPMLDQVKEAAKGQAQELKEELAPHAQEAAQQVKDTARDAAQQTAEDARGAADDVRSHAQGAVQDVRSQQ